MLRLFLSLVLVFSGMSFAGAQTLDGGFRSAPKFPAVEPKQEAARVPVSPDVGETPEEEKARLAVEAAFEEALKNVNDDTDDDIDDAPQLDRATKDGSKRGGMSIRPILADENAEDFEDDEFIFLYFTNFQISKSTIGTITCNVTFAVTTTLNTRVSNLSYRLKWPEMETTVSFLDVDPNTENVFTYTLLGQGCYSMDKIPNIIVNRCRVRGMTQQQCASKIRWLKK